MNVFTVREAHNSVADYSIACPELDVFNLFAGCAQTSWQPSPNAEFGAGLLKDVVIKGIKWPPRKVCAFVLFRCTSIQTSVLVCPTMLVLQLSFPRRNQHVVILVALARSSWSTGSVCLTLWKNVPIKISLNLTLLVMSGATSR